MGLINHVLDGLDTPIGSRNLGAMWPHAVVLQTLVIGDIMLARWLWKLNFSLIEVRPTVPLAGTHFPFR